MKLFYTALALAMVLSVSLSYAQLQKSDAVLTMTNGAEAKAVTFGIGVGATKCIDAAFGESDQPPFPPSGTSEMYINGDKVVETCLGEGVKVSYQPGSLTTSSVDSFRLRYQIGTDGIPVVFSWRGVTAAKFNSCKLFVTTASGATWGTTGSNVFDMMGADTSAELIINTDNGAPTFIRIDCDWKAIPATGVIDRNSNVPASFALNQNYPNPFNPTTSVPFSIEKSAFTDVVVYNILGQKVSTLVSQQMNPGTYTAHWNGVDDHGMAVSSGVYYVRMNANYGNGENFTSLRKMVLMK